MFYLYPRIIYRLFLDINTKSHTTAGRCLVFKYSKSTLDFLPRTYRLPGHKTQAFQLKMITHQKPIGHCTNFTSNTTILTQ